MITNLLKIDCQLRYTAGSFMSDSLICLGHEPPADSRVYQWANGWRWQCTAHDGEVLPGKFHPDGPVYIRGRKWTREQIEAGKFGTPILRRNMDYNDWTAVVECAQGAVPFTPGMVVLDPTEDTAE